MRIMEQDEFWNEEDEKHSGLEGNKEIATKSEIWSAAITNDGKRLKRALASLVNEQRPAGRLKRERLKFVIDQDMRRLNIRGDGPE